MQCARALHKNLDDLPCLVRERFSASNPSYASCIRPYALVPLQIIEISQKMGGMCSSHRPSHALTLLFSLSPHLIQPAPANKKSRKDLAMSARAA